MEQENQKEVNTGNKDMMPKESTQDKDLNLQSGTKTLEMIPEQPKQPYFQTCKRTLKTWTLIY